VGRIYPVRGRKYAPGAVFLFGDKIHNCLFLLGIACCVFTDFWVMARKLQSSLSSKYLFFCFLIFFVDFKGKKRWK